MCSDTWGGPKPFSEPETQAYKDFLTKNKKDIAFVYNFDTAGNQFIIPFNYAAPNEAFQKIPETMGFFKELIDESNLPEDFTIGPAIETIQMYTGGSAGDWINTHLGIPAAEVEIGAWETM